MSIVSLYLKQGENVYHLLLFYAIYSEAINANGWRKDADDFLPTTRSGAWVSVQQLSS